MKHFKLRIKDSVLSALARELHNLGDDIPKDFHELPYWCNRFKCRRHTAIKYLNMAIKIGIIEQRSFRSIIANGTLRTRRFWRELKPSKSKKLDAFKKNPQK